EQEPAGKQTDESPDTAKPMPQSTAEADPAATPSVPETPSPARETGSLLRGPGSLTWRMMRMSGKDEEKHASTTSGWKVDADSVLHCATSDAGWLKSSTQYGDFTLDLEFNLPAGG